MVVTAMKIANQPIAVIPAQAGIQTPKACVVVSQFITDEEPLEYIEDCRSHALRGSAKPRWAKPEVK